MKTIIVDDERWMLKRFEIECGDIPDVQLAGSFRSPLKALEFAQENRVELAFLDMEMPEMSGIELAAKLRESQPGIVIIFVSAYEQYMVEAFRKQLADYYIMKPYNSTDIENAVERARLLAGRLRKSVTIRTFGRFDVFIDGQPMSFTDAKEKELLALIVNAMGGTLTAAEAVRALWPGQKQDGLPEQDGAAEREFKRLLQLLQNTLRESKLEEMIAQNGQGVFLQRDSADCDLLAYKEGDLKTMRQFSGSYMEGYAWAENERRSLLSQQALLGEYSDTLTRNLLCACVHCKNDALLTITYANEGFLAVIGYTRDELAEKLHNSLRAVIVREDLARIMAGKSAADPAAMFADAEFRLVNSAGDEIWMLCKSAIACGGEETECLLIDISGLKTEQYRLEEEAQRDALTGLYNRGAAQKRIESYLTEFGASRVCALILMDVDNFKAVNDTYGHPFADTVLTDIAAILRRSFRSSDIVCRLGGDEMLIFLKDIGGELQVRAKLAAAMGSLSKRLKAKTRDGELSCSFGAALSPDDAQGYEALYRSADVALYAAKATKDCAVFFTETQG